MVYTTFTICFPVNVERFRIACLSLQAALKHADSQGVIEKMEQEMARLKLKHSLEVKVY